MSLEDVTVTIEVSLEQLQKAFNQAEDDTAVMFESKTCSMEDKDGEHRCPICYFRERVKFHLCDMGVVPTERS